MSFQQGKPPIFIFVCIVPTNPAWKYDIILSCTCATLYLCYLVLDILYLCYNLFLQKWKEARMSWQGCIETMQCTLCFWSKEKGRVLKWCKNGKVNDPIYLVSSFFFFFFIHLKCYNTRLQSTILSNYHTTIPHYGDDTTRSNRQ